MVKGLRTFKGAVAAPPYTNGPYSWDQFVAFTGGMSGANTSGKVWFVDGTSGLDTNDGRSWNSAKITIQAAITASSTGDTIYVNAIQASAGGTDPGSYTENLIIPATKQGISLIGVTRGRVQGGLPQIKVGTTTTSAILTVRACGCLIANLGFNGIGGTGGGILLDDDGSTKTALGTSIIGCHFKNCVGTTATNAATGGAIQWAATGGAWQVLISGNRFYKNVGDVVLLGTSQSVPQDVVIEDNVFSGPAASTDCNLYLAGGSGMNGVIIKDNYFTAFPNVGSGTNLIYADLTGCVGLLADNFFAGNGYTYKAAGTGGKIPATVLMAGNAQEVTASGGTSSGAFSRAS